MTHHDPGDAAVASLPMYDLPELTASTDAWWRCIAGHLGVDATIFEHPDDHEASWDRPGLVLGQSCGLPLVERLLPQVQVVGAFTYDGVSDAEAHYASVLVAAGSARPLTSFAGARLAVNDWRSLSGWCSLGAALHRAGVEGGPVTITGAHRRSLALLRDGGADLAAIDGVTLALLRRAAPAELEGLTEVGSAPRIPCLPLVTATGDVAALQRALAAAVADPAAADARRALLVTGFVPLTADDYLPVLALRDEALAAVPRPL